MLCSLSRQCVMISNHWTYICTDCIGKICRNALRTDLRFPICLSHPYIISTWYNESTEELVFYCLLLLLSIIGWRVSGCILEGSLKSWNKAGLIWNAYTLFSVKYEIWKKIFDYWYMSLMERKIRCNTKQSYR